MHRYRLEDKLGEGATSTVWRAIDLESSPPRTVAIKRTALSQTEAAARLELECATVAALNAGGSCRHVLPLVEEVRTPTELWLVTQHCELSLADVMRIARRPLTEPEIATAAAHLVAALTHVHACGVVHRDVKAANVLLAAGRPLGAVERADGGLSEESLLEGVSLGSCGGDSSTSIGSGSGSGSGSGAGSCIGSQPYVVLADFGCAARLTPPASSRRSSVVGSTFWLAPEVLRKEHYATEPDVWALGVTCLELAERRPPLARLPGLRALNAIVEGPPPRLSNSEGWSADFVDFLEKCLDKNPATRATAASLATHPFVAAAQPGAFTPVLAQCRAQIAAAGGLSAALGCASPIQGKDGLDDGGVSGVASGRRAALPTRGSRMRAASAAEAMTRSQQ